MKEGRILVDEAELFSPVILEVLPNIKYALPLWLIYFAGRRKEM